MIKKTKVLIAIGGTGGHVFPGINLAEHLSDGNFNIKLVTDKRGFKYIKNLKDINVSTLPSSRLIKKNIFLLILSFLTILYSILRSLFFLVFNRPNIIFGMGGYASFPICIAAYVLKIKFIIYENNLFIGKANKYLLPFAEKMLVSFEELEGVPEKYQNKVFKIGNIIKKEILEISKIKDENKDNNKLSILVLGGSQTAKVFAEKLPSIFKSCLDQGINLKIYQHCLDNQSQALKLFYKNINLEYETFNFSNNLVDYFSKVNLAITRSGSSILAELTNANVPFISVPLPSSADNHQLKNAIYYTKKNFSFLIEEKDLSNKLLSLISQIYKDKSILNEIMNKQRQHSDKDVYNNVDKFLKKYF